MSDLERVLREFARLTKRLRQQGADNGPGVGQAAGPERTPKDPAPAPPGTTSEGRPETGPTR